MATVEEVYFKQLLDNGKIDTLDALNYYREKCKELEARVDELTNALEKVQVKYKGGNSSLYDYLAL